MNDYYKSCKPKNSTDDFLASYHKLIDNLRNYGFNPSKSRISLDVNGFLMDGAHRLGLHKHVIEMTVLEYLKIQLHLNLTSQVSIVSSFSKDEDKETNMRSMLRNKCSRDGFIVYEKDVVITKLGMKQISIHMYGQQPWIKAKINNMKNLFYIRFSKSTILFSFLAEVIQS